MPTSTSCFTKFLHKIDCLTQIPIFRVNKQNSYKTKTGGIFTIIFVIIIMIILTLRIRTRQRGELMSYTRKQIISKDSITLASESQESSNTFIAIRIMDSNRIQYDDRYFSMYVFEQNLTNSQAHWIGYYLQPCSKKQLSGYFCLPGKNTLKISGQYNVNSNQVDQSWLQIYIQKCSGNDCANLSEYQGKSFFVQFFYQNYFLNLDQQIDYKQKIIKQTFINLVPDNIAYVSVDLTKFIMETDRNYLLPIPEGQSIKEQGYYILERPLIQNINSKNSEYILIYIRRSHLTTIIKRTDHTLIDIFAYVGGLATLVLAIIQFLAHQYNSYAFEVQLSYKLFSANEQSKDQLKKDNKNTDDRLNQQPQNKHSMVTNILPSINFFTFVKDKLPCFKKTARMKSYRSELNKQLDIQHLLRKINVFQNMLLLLLRRSSIIVQPKEINKYRIQQAQEFRKMFQFPQFEESEQIAQRQDKKTDKLQRRQYKGHLEIALQSNFNIETPDQCKQTNKEMIQVNQRGREQQF